MIVSKLTVSMQCLDCGRDIGIVRAIEDGADVGAMHEAMSHEVLSRSYRRGWHEIAGKGNQCGRCRDKDHDEAAPAPAAQPPAPSQLQLEDLKRQLRERVEIEESLRKLIAQSAVIAK